jgi:uncharacterized protein YabN with tetrapyrrole methylase and pyrophosphatase domain
MAAEQKLFRIDDALDAINQKLIRRHPHVFGDVAVEGPADVRRNWEEIKRTTEGRGAAGLFGDVPENLPSLSLAAKVQRRAEGEAAPAPFAAARTTLDALELAATEASPAGTQQRFAALGELLFLLVRCARALDLDAELALRQATRRFRDDGGMIQP